MPDDPPTSTASDWQPAPIVRWLLDDGRFSADLDALVRRLGDTMLAAGAPLWRLRLSMRTLHPLITAVTSMWERDGATVWQRIRHITLPMLSPTLLFLFVINVITSLQAFGEIDILTQGGPGQASENLVYSVFIDGFVGTRFRGLASAQAFLLAVMIIAVSFIQFRASRKRVHYG